MRFREIWISHVVWSVMFACGPGDCAQANVEEVVATLRGLENVRRGSEPFRVKGRFVVNDSREGVVIDNEVLIVCGNDKYWISAKNGLGTSVCINNGRDVMYFDGRGSAVVISQAMATSQFGFNPLIIGITPSYDVDNNFDDRIGYRSGSSLRLVDELPMNGVKTRQTELIDRFGQTVRMWVQPSLLFRVIKYQIVIPRGDDGGILSQYVSESEFSDDLERKWLPKRVSVKRYRGEIAMGVAEETILELEKPEWSPVLPDELWEMNGLGLPVGQPVADLRLKERIGYWDGGKLVPDVPREEVQAIGGIDFGEANRKAVRWDRIRILIGVNVAVVVLCLLLLLRKWFGTGNKS